MKSRNEARTDFIPSQTEFGLLSASGCKGVSDKDLILGTTSRIVITYSFRCDCVTGLGMFCLHFCTQSTTDSTDALCSFIPTPADRTLSEIRWLCQGPTDGTTGALGTAGPEQASGPASAPKSRQAPPTGSQLSGENRLRFGVRHHLTVTVTRFERPPQPWNSKNKDLELK